LDLRNLRLTVFLSENERAKIDREDLALVTVDAYPGEVFPGLVDKISAQAEFTPSDVQISEQRVKTVFRVVIVFSDFGGKLRPGMSAKAEFMP
jgi:HlyD family secretion protein